MPTNYIKKLVRTGKTEYTAGQLERKWEHAMKKAAEQEHKKDFGYIMQIFKSMAGIKESEELSFYEDKVYTMKSFSNYKQEQINEIKTLFGDAAVGKIGQAVNNVMGRLKGQTSDKLKSAFAGTAMGRFILGKEAASDIVAIQKSKEERIYQIDKDIQTKNAEKFIDPKLLQWQKEGFAHLSKDQLETRRLQLYKMGQENEKKRMDLEDALTEQLIQKNPKISINEMNDKIEKIINDTPKYYSLVVASGVIRNLFEAISYAAHMFDSRAKGIDDEELANDFISDLKKRLNILNSKIEATKSKITDIKFLEKSANSDPVNKYIYSRVLQKIQKMKTFKNSQFYGMKDEEIKRQALMGYGKSLSTMVSSQQKELAYTIDLYTKKMKNKDYSFTGQSAKPSKEVEETLSDIIEPIVKILDKLITEYPNNNSIKDTQLKIKTIIMGKFKGDVYKEYEKIHNDLIKQVSMLKSEIPNDKESKPEIDKMEEYKKNIENIFVQVNDFQQTLDKSKKNESVDYRYIKEQDEIAQEDIDEIKNALKVYSDNEAELTDEQRNQYEALLDLAKEINIDVSDLTGEPAVEKEPAKKEGEFVRIPIKSKVNMIMTMLKEYGFNRIDYKIQNNMNTIQVKNKLDDDIKKSLNDLAEQMDIILNIDEKQVGDDSFTTITFKNNLTYDRFKEIYNKIKGQASGEQIGGTSPFGGGETPPPGELPTPLPELPTQTPGETPPAPTPEGEAPVA